MKSLEANPYRNCDLGDKRLTDRAVLIAEALKVKYGHPLSEIFQSASDLKRGYEFFSNPKTTFEKLTQPSFKQTAQEIYGIPIVLAVGDTTYLDYKKILEKRDDYGPTGNGGNGLILHSSLALDPDFGQPLGLLSRVIHVFDREGDIAEVFALQRKNKNTGVVVRAAHNRCLSGENSYLWEYVTSQKVQFVKEVELPETKKRKERTATLEIRYCPVSINPPSRLKKSGNFNVYALFATEINVPDGCEPVTWMLLTSELVTTQAEASQILRWYTYRWRIEEYHKILKSGCKAESYRLAGESMSTMLGFLTVIAAQLLRMTYLHRNSPHSSAELMLTKIQMDVLLASTPPKQKKQIQLTVDWAIRAIARLGGYLEHRKNSPIGIQVLWRGWLELETLCQGWLLHENLK